MDAVILSSADIARILGGDAIIRQEAIVTIVDGRSPLGTEEKVYIYIDKYPSVDEFEATWKLRVVDSASDLGDLVRQAIGSVLPRLEVSGSDYLVKEFRTSATETRPEPSKAAKLAQEATSGLQESFSRLEQDIQDRMLLINSGRPGKDGRDGVDGLPGRDGRDGVDGRDGRDLIATDAELFDLKDVESGIPLEKGQVLTWDGSEWTNLFVPQLVSVAGGGGGGNTSVIISDDPPTERDDGSALGEGDLWWESDTGVIYVYYNGAWVQISGEGGSGVNTLAALLDTDVTGAQDGYVLVYRSDTDDWTAEPAPATGLQPGDNVSELTNDANYITLADVPDAPVDSVNGQTGAVVLTADDVGALESGDNISELVNDAGYITLADVPDDAPVDSVNGQTGVVVLDADDIDDASTTHKFATASQLSLADTSVQPGDNVSDLTNDAGYITLAEVPESGIPEAPQDGNYYVRQNGTWVSLADALTALENRTIDGGDFINGTSAGDTEIVDGGNFS